MSEETDGKLLTLFAQSQQALPDAEFLAAVWAKIARARRVRTLQRIALLACAAILAVWFMPSVLQSTAAALHAVGEYSESHVALIVSPAGWAVSTLIALGVLIRTGALRRR